MAFGGFVVQRGVPEEQGSKSGYDVVCPSVGMGSPVWRDMGGVRERPGRCGPLEIGAVVAVFGPWGV